MRAYIVPVLLILAVVFIAGCTSVKSPVCGDLKCDSKETVASCPVDCARCGDSICSRTETINSCEKDCAKCGDGICSVAYDTENQANCAADCTKADGSVDCPNGACDSGETVTTCYKDCVVVPAGTA
ncbi:MAG: hypothetical protein HYU56_03425 [Candidatus Aenigmarchaeota archaeon]|nr:hypothetical protein [Candidatus Aenigmarchaeota archaeon]